MLTSLIVSAVIALASHPHGEGVGPILVSPGQLAEGSLPDVLAPVEGLIRLYQPATETLGLTAYVSLSPPLVLFGPDERQDALRLLGLLQQTTRTFRATYGFEERAEVPLAAFWLQRREDYGALIDLLAARERYLESWSPVAKSINGFAIYRPELVCVLEGPSSPIGVNLENNLVHLTGHLLLGQHAGNQPFWVREGVGLDLESRVLGTLYGFCAAGKFVPMSRRGAWSRQIESYWLKKSELDADRLTELSQNRLDHDAALLALSTVRYLVAYHRDGLKAFFREIAADIDAHLREDLYYKVPPSRQEEILASILGREWRREALATMRSRKIWMSGERDGSEVAASGADTPAKAAARAVFSKLLGWSGNRRQFVKLVPARRAAVEAALDPWVAWCERRGYHGLVSKDGRVLLLLTTKRRHTSRYQRWLEKVCALVDDRIICRDAAAAGTGHGDGVSDPAGAPCVTLIEFRTQDDYLTALDALAEEYPCYSEARSSLGSSTGFVVQEPLVGGWLETAPGIEQWKPENELINRLTRLLLVGEYGRLPEWILAGASWWAELELTESVHSFPHRSEFVAIGEHAGWRQPLRMRYRRRDAEPITMAEITSFGQGVYESMQAGLCWGMIEFLVTQYPGSLGGILADFSRDSAADPGGWRQSVIGEAPAEAQLDLIERHTSPDCLTEARQFFAGGCRAVRHRSRATMARKRP